VGNMSVNKVNLLRFSFQYMDEPYIDIGRPFTTEVKAIKLYGRVPMRVYRKLICRCRHVGNSLNAYSMVDSKAG